MAGRARPKLRVWHRWLLVRLARDTTSTTGTRSALVIAPHPDDETIACGGTVARKAAAGTRVRVVIAADGGNEERRAEAVLACERLGLSATDLTFVGLPDGQLTQHGDEIDVVLAALLEERVEELYSPSRIDAHPDHRALAAAVERLSPLLLENTVRYSYPVWFWNRWAWVDRSTPAWRQWLQLTWRPLVHVARTRTAVVATAGYLEQKRAALDAHVSQVVGTGSDAKPLDPSWLAIFMGSEELFFVDER